MNIGEGGKIGNCVLSAHLSHCLKNLIPLTLLQLPDEARRKKHRPKSETLPYDYFCMPLLVCNA